MSENNEQTVSALVIGGLSGGSGKSVATIGLIGALRERGVVAPFKKGPDYIDGGWMSRAAARPCCNLDPYLMDPETVRQVFVTHLGGADFAVVEGNRGLYDGVNVEGGYSTAELARQLGLPVLLVVNCAKTTRTVAAMVLGCREMDSGLNLAGVILNQIATPRHEAVVSQAVERYAGVPVVGVVPRMKRDIFPMRHLGVTPHQESADADRAVRDLADLARDRFDLDRIVGLMAPVTPAPAEPVARTGKRVRIGILRDAAFQFYYQENLEALERLGADLVMIDALRAESLPASLDGLYIGGGFPETSARQLADNDSFRTSIRAAAQAGLPIYAECGGLIFLGRAIVLDGTEYPLCDVFPVTFGLSKRPQAHGYSRFRVEKKNPFYSVGTVIRGHEFRYSTVDRWDGGSGDLVLKMERGTGFRDGRDGLHRNNVLALYTHVLAPGTPEWALGLVRAARSFRG